jgi:uridine kinase
VNLREEIAKQREKLQSGEKVNFVIAGVTCSGKTTLARKLNSFFKNIASVCIVSQDDYFRDLADIPKTAEGYLTDSINAFHTSEFKEDVEKLFANEMVLMPRYDIATNTRISKSKLVNLGAVNIFEGLHTITLLEGLENSIKIFVDTPAEVCLQRRIERDTAKFGIPEERIRQYWEKCIWPMSKSYILPQKELADSIFKA